MSVTDELPARSSIEKVRHMLPGLMARGAGRAWRADRRARAVSNTMSENAADSAATAACPRALDEVIGDCAVYSDGRRRPGRAGLAEAGRVAREGDGFVWIGLQQPTAQDIAEVAAEFGLPPMAVEDAVQAHQRPRLQVHGGVLFVVLKPVRYVDHDEVVDVSELAIFLGEHFVVSVRHGDSDVLTRVRHTCDLGDRHVLDRGPIGVLHRAVDLVVDGYAEALGGIEDDVDSIESAVFSEDESDHSERIYMLKREVAEFRRAVMPLSGPLEKLAEGKVPGVDAALAPYFRDVQEHAVRASEAIEHLDRLLFDVLQADLARAGARQSMIAMRQNEIAMRQNEDMRRISAWAAIGLVPTAIAGVYGMNFENMPETRWEYGYFCVVGVIVTACFVLYRAFRRNGWL